MTHPKRAHPQHSTLATLLGTFGIAAVVLAGVGIATAGQNLPVGLDQGWHDVLAAHRLPAADAIALFLNIAGGTLVMTIVSVVIVVVLLFFRQFQASFSIAVTMALATGLSSVIKSVIARPRPSDGTVDVASNAFPSGHATAAAAITVALLIAFPRVWTWVLAGAWIPLVAISRNYLLVHWLSDVIGGVVLGASVALLVSGLVQGFLKKRSPDRDSITAKPQSASTTVTT